MSTPINYVFRKKGLVCYALYYKYAQQICEKTSSTYRSMGSATATASSFSLTLDSLKHTRMQQHRTGEKNRNFHHVGEKTNHTNNGIQQHRLQLPKKFSLRCSRLVKKITTFNVGEEQHPSPNTVPLTTGTAVSIIKQTRASLSNSCSFILLRYLPGHLHFPRFLTTTW